MALSVSPRPTVWLLVLSSARKAMRTAPAVVVIVLIVRGARMRTSGSLRQPGAGRYPCHITHTTPTVPFDTIALTMRGHITTLRQPHETQPPANLRPNPVENDVEGAPVEAKRGQLGRASCRERECQ